MSDARFNIVFSGELVAGADPAKVRENLAKVFKMELAKVEALFSGKPVVIKKDADQATAMKFRAVLRQAGAQVEMVPLGGEPETVEAAPPPPAPEPDQSPAAAPATEPAPAPVAEAAPAAVAAADDTPADMETVGTIRTGGEGFSSEFDVAPVGADMADEKEGPAPINPDISHLSMAPPGADLEQIPDEREKVDPDVSHISLSEDGAGQG